MTLRVGACLSLSGPHARFGAQAGEALRVWQDLTPGVAVTVEDDRGSTRTLRETLPSLAARCDVLLGPYATHLTRAAAEVAADMGLLLWNHGGAGDDVQTGHPGHLVSVPTPAGRYAEPYLRGLAGAGRELVIVHGRGGFGRQAASGAARLAVRLGIPAVRVGTTETLPSETEWDLFTAGSFDEDVRTVNHVAGLREPPSTVCAVAAGVSEFGHAVADPAGVHGIAQWFPGNGAAAEAGPAEAEFVSRYTSVRGTPPDYPAVQAAAAAVLATHCATVAGATRAADLWAAATALDTRTLFGPFRVDQATGAQTGHDTVLTVWDAAGKAHAA